MPHDIPRPARPQTHEERTIDLLRKINASLGWIGTFLCMILALMVVLVMK